MTTPADGGRVRVPYPNVFAGRALSFVLASALSILVFAFPDTIASESGSNRPWLLVPMMWGIACGFIHGVGFVPRSPLWRLTFNPLPGWLLMSGGIAWILLT